MFLLTPLSTWVSEPAPVNCLHPTPKHRKAHSFHICSIQMLLSATKKTWFSIVRVRSGSFSRTAWVPRRRTNNERTTTIHCKLQGLQCVGGGSAAAGASVIVTFGKRTRPHGRLPAHGTCCILRCFVALRCLDLFRRDCRRDGDGCEVVLKGPRRDIYCASGLALRHFVLLLALRLFFFYRKRKSMDSTCPKTMCFTVFSGLSIFLRGHIHLETICWSSCITSANFCARASADALPSSKGATPAQHGVNAGRNLDQRAHRPNLGSRRSPLLARSAEHALGSIASVNTYTVYK